MPIKSTPVLLMLFCVWLVSWQSVNAAIIDDLYDAKIAVVDQSQRSQNNAFSIALQQVLIKVRGNNDLLSDPKIQSAMTKATRFVRSYSYDKQESQLFLEINFDPQRVQNLIRNAGFPVWDKRRPDSIIWLAIQASDNSPRQIARPNKYFDLYQQLSQRAEQRGIRLMYPLWDLDDVQTLGVYDIWGGFSAQISKASERYAVPSVVSARIYLSDTQAVDAVQDNGIGEAVSQSQWTADWSMIEAGTLLEGQLQGDSPLIIAAGLVDVLADQLSLKYAIDLTQIDAADSKVQIVVNNIDSLKYYSQVLSFLENMSVVNAATLIKQQGPRATFELELLGNVDDLSNALSLDSKIKAVVDDFGQPIVGLEFFWVK